VELAPGRHGLYRRLILALVSVLVAGCGGAGGGAGSNAPINVAVIAGLSGANSVVAPSVVQEAQLAIDELNAGGGVLGRKLNMQVFDDGSGADGAVKAFDTAVFQKHADVIVAMETSAARNAGAPIAARGHVPFIYTSFYEGGACNKYLYVDAEVPEQMATPLVRYLSDEKHARRFFLIGSDYAFGRGELAATRKLIEGSGGTVVGEEYNPIDATDWTAILSKVRSANPDAVITSTAGGAPNVSLLKQYRSAGLMAPVGSLSLDEGTAKSIGADADGVYLAATYFTTVATPQNKRFLQDVQKKFGGDLKTPNDLSVPEYDGVHLYAEAARRAGSADPDKILAALPAVAFTGPNGSVQMSKQHHAALPIYLGQVANGTVDIIKSYGQIDPGPQCPSLGG
jgi:urea transport system substrate-binding protein